MREFFQFETEVPAGSGFTLFGTGHLLWLLGIGIFVAAVGIWYMRQIDKVQRRVEQCIGILFPVLSFYRDGVLMLTGHFDRGFLPFHLCSMALWIAVIYVWTGSRFFGIVYVLLCVPGALGALLFPDWSAYPFFNYMCIHGFVAHGLIVGFGVWLVMSGRLVPRWRDFWMPFVFGVAGFILIPRLNHALGTNYWFLSRPSKGSPMVFIMDVTGEQWYMPGYFLFCTLVVVVWQCIIKLFYAIADKWERMKMVNTEKKLGSI